MGFGATIMSMVRMAISKPVRVVTIVLVLSMSATITPVAAIPVLKQVQVITRHGARTPLTKMASSLVEGGASLTPLGELQLYELGVWLRTRYSALLGDYASTEAVFESSSFDRTIVSASSLAQGLFPAAQRDPKGESLLPVGTWRTNIPVYTPAAQSNDVEIRAYDKCPAFTTKLTDLYQSSAWTTYEAGHFDLLARLANVSTFSRYAEINALGLFVPLKKVWNVYDAINVAKTECAGTNSSSGSCLSLPDPSIRHALSDDDWAELQEIAHHAEHQKYGVGTAGTLLGGNLLLKIFERMGGDVMGGGAGDDRRAQASVLVKFHLYSAHYPTILGVLAALGEPPLSNEVIPNYASALIFELYEDSVSSARSVRLLYKEGLQNAAVSLQLDGACGGSADCPMVQFTTMLFSMGYTTKRMWCHQCENTMADVCLAPGTSSTVVTCEEEDSGGTIAGAFFGGTFFGMIFVLAFLYLRSQGFCKCGSEFGGEELKDDSVIVTEAKT